MHMLKNGKQREINGARAVNDYAIKTYVLFAQ